MEGISHGEWLGNQTAADQLTASVLALRQESASIGTTITSTARTAIT